MFSRLVGSRTFQSGPGARYGKATSGATGVTSGSGL